MDIVIPHKQSQAYVRIKITVIIDPTARGKDGKSYPRRTHQKKAAPIMANIYDCARDIIDLAESTQDIEKIAEVLTKQRILLDRPTEDKLMVLIVVPTGIEKAALDARYPLLMVGESGLEVSVPDWKSEMHHREKGFAVKRE